MKASVAIPTCTEGLCYPIGAGWGTKAMIEMSVRAEELRFDAVWGNDHLTTQGYVRREYADPPNYFEPLISLGWIAGQTSRIRLATGLIVLPLRDPVVLAKQVATLDAVSNGRFDLGVGIGAYREELEAVRPREAKMNRGAVLEESVDALRVLFTERRASYSGTYIQFQDVEMYPKPVQRPLPIYIGGNADATLERVGRSAEGWYPAVQSIEAVAEKVRRIHAAARAAGRDPSSIDIAPQLIVSIGRTTEEAEAAFRDSQLYRHLESLSRSTLKGQGDVIQRAAEYNLMGTPEEIVRRARRYAEAGVTHLAALIFVGDSSAQTLQQMELFAKEVLPAIREF